MASVLREVVESMEFGGDNIKILSSLFDIAGVPAAAELKDCLSLMANKDQGRLI